MPKDFVWPGRFGRQFEKRAPKWLVSHEVPACTFLPLVAWSSALSSAHALRYTLPFVNMPPARTDKSSKRAARGTGPKKLCYTAAAAS